MKYLTILAISSIVAANPLVRRREAQPAADSNKLLTLRANFCIDSSKAECQETVGKCEDGSKIIEDCIQDEHPACIQDESSSCSKDVAQCLAEFGKQQDADQAIKDCIVEKVIRKPAADGGDKNLPDEAGSEQMAPSNPASPECKKAGAEYLEAWLTNDCDEGNDSSNSESPACKNAGSTFEQAWAANNCEEEVNAEKRMEEIQ
ncbi:hypothetical protein VCV18_012702 [Metarhizium anisopliae]